MCYSRPALIGDHHFTFSLSSKLYISLLGRSPSLVMALAEVSPNDLSGLTVIGKRAWAVMTQ